MKSLKKNCQAKKSFLVREQVKKISDKEYENVPKVWNKFEMKTMKNYHDLDLKCDVLLLADVFQKFRNNTLKNCGLCPSHYLNAPALKVVSVSLTLFFYLGSIT